MSCCILDALRADSMRESAEAKGRAHLQILHSCPRLRADTLPRTERYELQRLACRTRSCNVKATRTTDGAMCVSERGVAERCA